MSSPVSPVKVDVAVAVEKSCNNWKCCFGCRKVTVEESQVAPLTPESVDIHTTIEKTVRTYETHHSHQSHKERK